MTTSAGCHYFTPVTIPKELMLMSDLKETMITVARVIDPWAFSGQGMLQYDWAFPADQRYGTAPSKRHRALTAAAELIAAGMIEGIKVELSESDITQLAFEIHKENTYTQVNYDHMGRLMPPVVSKS